MGTTWHVTFLSVAGGPAVDSAQHGIQSVLDQVNASMSTYLPDSEVSRFNRLSVGQWFAISDDFARVLQAAREVGDHSDGAYDISVGPLVDLWGFGPAKIVDAVPPQEEIDKLMGQVGQSALDIDALQIRKTHELSLDLSSIAKGFAVDKVAQWLLDQGVSSFLVEVGGEMRASGHSARGDNWRIAIEQPEAGARSVAAAVSLSRGAVATSGDYRNFFTLNGKRYSHTIDPRTGYPIDHDLVSVTVVHDSAMLADAWATALTVLGAEQGMAVAQSRGLAVYFIRKTASGFEHSYNPAFAPLLEPKPD